MGRPTNELTREFLLSRIHVNGNRCWEWQGTLVRGYGQVSINWRKYRPHRLVAHLWLGFDLNSNKYVCHSCDNPACCNPSHLFIGTAFDNHKDMVIKNRRASFKGSKHGNAKIDENDALLIIELFKAGWPQLAIAEVFPCGYGAIKNICQGRSWQHIGDA